MKRTQFIVLEVPKGREKSFGCQTRGSRLLLHGEEQGLPMMILHSSISVSALQRCLIGARRAKIFGWPAEKLRI